MKNYLAIVVGTLAMLSSAHSFAEAGPSKTIPLVLTLKNPSSLSANWTPVAGLSTEAVKSSTVIGTLDVQSRYVHSVTIKSANPSDATLSGNVTFSKSGTPNASFQTVLSSSITGINLTKAAGQTTIAATDANGNLPNSVAIKFTTVPQASGSIIPGGEYTATVNMTSVIL